MPESSITAFLEGIGLNHSIVMFLISMIPFVELRGAIPYGHLAGLDPISVFVESFIGNCIPIPFVILLARPMFSWLKKFKLFAKIIGKIESAVEKKADKVKANKYEMLGLFLFVAVPLPGTGAYSGALIAALLGMRLKYAIPAIVVGVFVAGLIMTAISFGVVTVIGIA